MAKRKQVKNACVNCQKACKKCDDSRPCERCIKYKIEYSCVNSSRKERKRGVKRGPYKKDRYDHAGSELGSKSWGGDDVSSSGGNGDDMSWLQARYYDRPVRTTRKKVDYNQLLSESGESEEEESEEQEEDMINLLVSTTEEDESHIKSRTRTEFRNEINPSVSKKHVALFKMVLGVLRKGVKTSDEKPGIRELAAVCAEIMELENGKLLRNSPILNHPKPTIALTSYDVNRSLYNVTPLASLYVREWSTPPNTPPLDLKGQKDIPNLTMKSYPLATFINDE